MEENNNQPLAQESAPKHKLNKANIVMAVLLVLSIAAATTFGILWGAERNRDPEVVEKIVEVEKVIEKDTVSTEPETSAASNKPLMFDASLIVNGDANTEYHVSIRDEIASTATAGYPYALSVYSTGDNTARIDIAWPDINQIYGSNHAVSEDRSSADNHESFDVQFSQHVADIFIGGIGQMVGHESIFYLMEDGTVESTDIKTAAQNGNFSTHSKVDGLENIVKFYSVSASPKGSSVGGYGTSSAQASDGKIYLLFHAQ